MNITTSRKHAFWLDGKPHPKERPRFSKTGHTYTPTKSRDIEKQIGNDYDGPKYDGPVRMEIVFTVDGTAVTLIPIERPDDLGPQLRGDIDNYTKTIMDALNGKAWGDDVQVMELSVSKL